MSTSSPSRPSHAPLSSGCVEVGTIGVDAGLCWIGDPCYILHRKNDEESGGPPEALGSSWSEFCDKLFAAESGGATQWNYDLGHPGLGVTVSTGYGDGSYPVYVRRNSEGRIAEVRVVFISDEEDES